MNRPCLGVTGFHQHMSASNIEHRGSPQLLRHSYTIIHADRELAQVLGAILFAMFIHRSDRRGKRDKT